MKEREMRGHVVPLRRIMARSKLVEPREIGRTDRCGDDQRAGHASRGNS